MNDPTLLSLLPPILTIVLAIATRNVILSLGLGVFVGMTTHEGFNPFAGLVSVFEKGLFPQLSKGSNAQVIILICVIGGLVRQLDSSGGMAAFAARITGRVNTKAKAEMSVLTMGIAIFFTDAGNSLILGPLFRPVFDKLKICREKLAFILDSTSSPVCVLVPFISWGVYIMSLIDQSYRPIDPEVNPLRMLVSALPFQFYPMLALCSVIVFALIGRDFGPMLRAQWRHADPEQAHAPETPSTDEERSRAGAAVVLLPLATLFIIIIGLFGYYYVSLGSLPSDKIRTSLILAYLAAGLVCAIVLRKQTGATLSSSASTFMQGMQDMFTIALVLLLAWSLGEVCALLGTSDYLAGLLSGNLPSVLLPALIFILGAVIALSTGSSYGTFAILMPIAIPLAVTLDAPMSVTIAAVLSGGILGDHASPISDTTILSSMATGCNHADHVNTQLPYALLTGAAALVSFVVAGLTASVWSMLVGLPVLIVLILWATRVEQVERPA